jgi:hypothetical protein
VCSSDLMPGNRDNHSSVATHNPFADLQALLKKK